MKRLGFALLSTALIMGTAFAGPVATDASAVAAFLSLGLAAAPSNFATVRGRQTFSNEFGMAWDLGTWPDRTRFAKCWTGHDLADDVTGQSERYYYKCESTPRAPSSLHFATIEKSVRAGLPTGYTSSGVSYDDLHRPSEVWRRVNSPNVALEAYTLVGKDLGKAVYALSIETYP